MRFAYLIVGDFDDATDRVEICNGAAQMIGVKSVEDAVRVAQRLHHEGTVDCIELCGAFGEEGAKKIIEITENKLPVGYMTHLPEQDDLFRAAFANL